MTRSQCTGLLKSRVLCLYFSEFVAERFNSGIDKVFLLSNVHIRDPEKISLKGINAIIVFFFVLILIIEAK
ncbi:hypothetical protein SAMN05216325_101158 [Nitrosomonas marina]|uniref:Uncharacterized protein n=1 Tax=Nitrosomonas marina TaxID=917 RepID=A0A1H8AI32_9PROT|nr:hypothetical protein SAMN05216325_101158 [Nitrosomonas marina]